MWTLSGFVDETSDDLAARCKVATGLGLRYVEVRSAWRTNIVDLDKGQLGTVPMGALRDDGFDGFFSLEPDLGDISSAGAFSDPELFTQAWKAFTNLLNREGIPYI